MKVVGAALAVFFAVVQFYTSFASLSPTPPVGYVFAPPAVAALLVASLVAAALVCAGYLLRDGALRGASPSHRLLAAWLLGALLASLLGLDPASGLAVTGMMALAACFHLALVRAFRLPQIARSVLTPYLLCGTAAALAGVVFTVLRVPAALWALNHGRAAGVFVTANQFAAFTLTFGFVALGTALSLRGRLGALGAAAAVAAAVALVATVSLAALLGAAAGAIFYAFALGARRFAALLAVAAFAGCALALLHPAVAHNPSDQFVRLRFWEAGRRAAALFPLTGVGPMAYWRVYPAIAPPDGDPPGTFGALHPHNAYLSLAGETGAFGLAACAYGWSWFVRGLRTGLRTAPPGARRFALGTCAALIAVLVQGLFDTIGIVQMCFVWIPFTALALAAVRSPDFESRA